MRNNENQLLCNYFQVYSTLNCEVGCSNGVVAGPRCGGPAEVDSAVFGIDISNDKVSIAQHLGVVHINGFTVRTAPGDDGPGVACGRTLHNHRFAKRNGDILRSCNDSGPLTWFRGYIFTRKGEKKIKINSPYNTMA